MKTNDEQATEEIAAIVKQAPAEITVEQIASKIIAQAVAGDELAMKTLHWIVSRYLAGMK